MSFVSYAQNFEDVMLWRALHDVPCGFYIDVGAAWATEHSVTRAFYDRGWSGVNIEPNPECWSLLNSERPNDVNLNLAVSDEPGDKEMFIFEGTGLSTLYHDIAMTHVDAGRPVELKKVATMTLADVWQEHVPGGDVHFLKVDVEGAEAAVLKSNDWDRLRPWIVVVESTLPLSEVESHEGWESILLDASYQFVYADGLNRFYLAGEHSDLASRFSVPPNIFDDFVYYEVVKAQSSAAEARRQAEHSVARTDLLQDQLNAMSSRLEELAGDLGFVRAQKEQLAEALDVAQASAAESEARVAELQAFAVESEAQRAEFEQAASRHQRELIDVKAALQTAHRAIRELSDELRAVRSSTSWRITAPLRGFRLGIDQVRRSIRQRIAQRGHGHRAAPDSMEGEEAQSELLDSIPVQLVGRQRRIYRDLQRAIASKNAERR